MLFIQMCSYALSSSEHLASTDARGRSSEKEEDGWIKQLQKTHIAYRPTRDRCWAIQLTREGCKMETEAYRFTAFTATGAAKHGRFLPLSGGFSKEKERKIAQRKRSPSSPALHLLEKHLLGFCSFVGLPRS